MPNLVVMAFQFTDLEDSVPIAYELMARHGIGRTVIVTLVRDKDSDQDYRVRLLRTLGEVEVVDLDDLIGGRKSSRLGAMLIRRLSRSRIGWVLYRTLFKRFFINLGRKRAAGFSLDQLSLDQGESIIVLSSYNSSINTAVIEQAKERAGVLTALFPSGVRVRTFPDEELVLSNWKNKRNMADICLSPNSNFAESIVPAVGESRVATLGSPRFCSEWLDVLSEIVPRVELPEVPEGKLKIVFMLNRWTDVVWKHAALQAMRYLASRDDVFLLLKPHPREPQLDVPVEGGNVRIVRDVHSSHLTDWADLVLFIKSSVFVEAIAKRKNVLHMRYLTSVNLSCAAIMRQWNVDSLEDLMDRVEMLVKDNGHTTYSEEERQACLDYYVHSRGGSVLAACATKLLTSLEEKQAQEAAAGSRL